MLCLTNALPNAIETKSILPTFTCFLKNKQIRCLKDIGCQSNFIETKLAEGQKLKTLQDNIKLKVTGFNSAKEYITKIVEVPLNIGTKLYKVPAICVLTINIAIHIDALCNVAKKFFRQKISVSG